MSDLNIPKNLSNPPPELKTSFEVFIIKQNVNSINDKIKEMETNGISDPFDMELAIMESHPDFYQSNPFLVKKLCKRDDISFLYKMLENLEKVENGDMSLASVELNLGQELKKQYLDPVLNKKK
jgi:hypothetical protein